ncbi:MAG TPA: DCC1-like thiol-disulfide oxidoreductase family protein [Saprospiraceae bacterium]|nr:DCC1-like thiol-disulfide oxidoreductase family protein [Saprospiraceae bacterium]
MNPGQYIILYDGDCGFCNQSVMFIIRNDRQKNFLFASLQSEIAGDLLKPFNIRPSLNSMILLKEGQYYEKSGAALEIVQHLSGVWPLLSLLKIIPRPIRDGVYCWIARHRHRFLSDTACTLPIPVVESRFLK